MPLSQNKPVSRRSLDNIIRFSTSIGENTEFIGNFSGGENIVVRGHVKGESDACDVVMIAETGCWDGKLVADTVHEGHIDMNTATTVKRFQEKRDNPTNISA